MAKLIGSINELEEGVKGLRFELLDRRGDVIPAFVICFENQYFAYLNRCGHIAVQLDYLPGRFFSDDGQSLVCSTHGAEYAPDDGRCLGGPCYGVGLEPLKIEMLNDQLYLLEDKYRLVNKS
jgi:nitrite reductase/ring-hydroxylating ferredoxin subunit